MKLYKSNYAQRGNGINKFSLAVKHFPITSKFITFGYN